MAKSRFIELMAKRMGKTASAEELAELTAFLNRFPHYRKLDNVVDALKGDVVNSEPTVEKTNIDTRLALLWDKIKDAENELEKKPKTSNIKRIVYWRWLAAMLIITAGGLLWFTELKKKFNEPNVAVLHEIYVPYGKTKILIMPDGTKITLNAGSKLVYPEFFSKSTRDVTLQGEGFFEVTKNRNSPFLVHTDKLTIRVLGTVFNVKAYHDGSNIETTLLTGRIQVELKDKPEKNVVLLPHEKLTVGSDLSAAKESPVKKSERKVEYEVTTLPNARPADIEETAWLDNRIVFTNASFADVAKQIERKYDVNIVFESDLLQNELISGVVDQETLEKALQLIKQTTPFKFKIDGKDVYIKKQ